MKLCQSRSQNKDGNIYSLEISDREFFELSISGKDMRFFDGEDNYSISKTLLELSNLAERIEENENKTIS